MLVTLSHQGYIKRMSPDIYRAQGRGGKGVTGVDTKEGDFIERLIVADNHDYFLVFTADGWVHWLKVYKIPELARTSQGRFIENLLDFGAEGDKGPDGQAIRPKVMSILPVRVVRRALPVHRLARRARQEDAALRVQPAQARRHHRRRPQGGRHARRRDHHVGPGRHPALDREGPDDPVPRDRRAPDGPARGRRHRHQVQERGRPGRRRRGRGRHRRRCSRSARTAGASGARSSEYPVHGRGGQGVSEREGPRAQRRRRRPRSSARATRTSS